MIVHPLSQFFLTFESNRVQLKIVHPQAPVPEHVTMIQHRRRCPWTSHVTMPAVSAPKFGFDFA